MAKEEQLISAEFMDNLSVQVGDGSRTSFWEDV